MQSYNNQCVENRNPIHTGKLNMPMRQEGILCCTMKGKGNTTSMIQIGNLEIDGIEGRSSRGRHTIIQKKI